MFDVLVVYTDGKTQNFTVRSTKAGEDILELDVVTGLLGVPLKNIRVYQVTQHETKETQAQPDGETSANTDVQEQGSSGQEETTATGEEA